MKKPNAIQKILHLFFMQKPITAFFAPRIHVMDTFILRMSNGKKTLSEILGFTIAQVITTGAKTGEKHAIILVAVIHDEKIALIGSNFGRKPNPGWYYNLKKYPECEVRLNGRSGVYLARETDGEEREFYWDQAVALYAGYAKYKERASHRRIPVMLLEPRK